MRRLLTYLKPHKWTMTIATTLVLFIIVVELYRPIIIGDAIDNYINGYYQPFTIAVEGAKGAVPYGDIWLTRDGEPSASEPSDYYQLFLYEDRYYMAEGINAAESEALTEGSPELIQSYVDAGAPCLEREQLKALRRYDFTGILYAAGLYLLMMALGFVLNAVDTWMLQKMGQNIIFRMREQVFTHIHSLSLSFFNTTPVGKLVTRVSNDTEAVNELFTTILVRLFKNVVKILGYAVVMLSISVRMALVSFALLPVVGVLTFVFRFYSRKAYQITRNKITELNTFLSEHISGMRLIQV
ncbi:MAG: ABC transporter ATP-binding protein, partial [Acetatifactor sp.]|nr:ABC transporter ATP-binding protein [Acetatifactor sp.]